MSLPAFSPHWPTVPACHGWLSLDRRGNWRLQGERVAHPGLLALLNGHYQCDATGAWFVQNGPQRVFVTLAYTPWVLRLQTDDQLVAHTGRPVRALSALHLDEAGNVLLHSELGIGLLDDRDLPALLAQCRLADGQPADDEALLHRPDAPTQIRWRGHSFLPIRQAEVATRFGYRPTPHPAPGGDAA